jgi:hypothetical protein
MTDDRLDGTILVVLDAHGPLSATTLLERLARDHGTSTTNAQLDDASLPRPGRCPQDRPQDHSAAAARQGDPTAPADQGGRAVFRSKQGKRLSAPTFSWYWSQVTARARLDFVPYEATKHYGVHLLYAAGVSARTIGKLASWSEGAVEELLKVYGHGDVAAQSEIDRLYAVEIEREEVEA